MSGFLGGFGEVMGFKSFQGIFECFLLGLCWGPSFLFIKIAIEELDPITLVAFRVTVTGLIFWALVKLKGHSLPPFGKVWLHLSLMGAISAVIPFWLFSYSELHISSALAGILNGITPIVTVALAHFFLPSEKMNFSKGLGLLCGVVGFLIILMPTLLDGGIEGDTLGMLAAAAAGLCYAGGIVYARKNLPHLPPLVAPAAQFVTTGFYMIPLTLAVDPTAFQVVPSVRVIAAVAGLIFLGTVAAFILYYRILNRSGASTLAMAVYMLPVHGTLFGYIFLGERLKGMVYLAALFIIVGMMIVNGTIKIAKPRGLPVPRRSG